MIFEFLKSIFLVDICCSIDVPILEEGQNVAFHVNSHRKTRQIVVKQDKMSIFNRIFSSASEEDKNSVGWQFLTDITMLEALTNVSNQVPVLIFKHSTRCSISRFALKEFERGYDYPADKLQPYFLDLLSYRDISNAITDRFEIVHQSPQILVVWKGKCIFTASHSDIDVKHLEKIVGILT